MVPLHVVEPLYTYKIYVGKSIGICGKGCQLQLKKIFMLVEMLHCCNLLHLFCYIHHHHHHEERLSPSWGSFYILKRGWGGGGGGYVLATQIVTAPFC